MTNQELLELAERISRVTSFDPEYIVITLAYETLEGQVHAESMMRWAENRDDVEVFKINHLVVGECDALSIRAIRDGLPTKAFIEWLHFDPSDDERHDALVREASVRHTKEVAKIYHKVDLTDAQAADVFDSLPEEEQENRDDRGAYPFAAAVEKILKEKKILLTRADDGL